MHDWFNLGLAAFIPTSIQVLARSSKCWLCIDPHTLIASHTKPGGWFELCEYDPRFVSDDGTLPADSYETKWSTLMCDASGKYGRPVLHYHEYKNLIKEAGFEDVHEEVFKVPSSPWPKDARLKELGQVSAST